MILVKITSARNLDTALQWTFMKPPPPVCVKDVASGDVTSPGVYADQQTPDIFPPCVTVVFKRRHTKDCRCHWELHQTNQNKPGGPQIGGGFFFFFTE